MVILLGFIALNLGLIAFQDFKHRAVSWWVFPILLAAIIGNGFFYSELVDLLLFAAINIFFLAFQILVLFAYFAVKRKKITNIINQQIGIGDVVFLVLLAFAFSTINFIVFYGVSIFLTLLIALLYQTIVKRKDKTIPLAGIISIIFLSLLIICYFAKFNLYDDLPLKDFLTRIYATNN